MGAQTNADDGGLSVAPTNPLSSQSSLGRAAGPRSHGQTGTYVVPRFDASMPAVQPASFARAPLSHSKPLGPPSMAATFPHSAGQSTYAPRSAFELVAKPFASKAGAPSMPGAYFSAGPDASAKPFGAAKLVAPVTPAHFRAVS